MASKGPKIVQSLRQGLRNLLGGSAEKSEARKLPLATASAPKAAQSREANQNSTLTKETKDVSTPSHNPFAVYIDPMSNVPERPFIPPLERGNQFKKQIADLQSKSPRKNSNNSLNDNKDKAAITSEADKTDDAKDNIVSDTREPIKIVSIDERDRIELGIELETKDVVKDSDINDTLQNTEVVSEAKTDIKDDNKVSEEILDAPDIVTTSNKGAAEPPLVEKAKIATRLFEAMAPIRQVIKPHTPLIRFRKGVSTPILSHDVAQAADMVSKEDKAEPIESSVPISAGNWKSVPVLHEWWDTPVRFKRREVDELECDIINGGGCDKIYQ